jgi:hypothetical protein
MFCYFEDFKNTILHAFLIILMHGCSTFLDHLILLDVISLIKLVKTIGTLCDTS